MTQTPSLQSYADAQLDSIRESESCKLVEKRVHALRVAMKRLRSLMRLLQPLAKEAKSMKTRLWEISHRLEPYREADVLRHTSHELRPGQPALTPKLPKPPKQSEELVAVAEELLRLTPTIRELADDSRYKASELRESAKKTFKKWRKAYRRAKTSGRDDDFHEFRKRGKDLLYQCEALFGEGAAKPRKSLKKLATCLGDAHDLFMFEQHAPPEVLKNGEDLSATIQDRKKVLYDESLKRAKKVQSKAKDVFTSFQP